MLLALLWEFEDAVDSLRRGAREPWIAAMIALLPTLLFVSSVYLSRSYELWLANIGPWIESSKMLYDHSKTSKV